MFIIPKYTIAKIEQIFSNFLWFGKMGNASCSKIRWEYVCLPKEEGGLGLRHVKDSNDASVMKHIWNMFYRKESLWVAWVQRIYLKQGSLWCAKISSICSWSWRKILHLRDRIRPFIRHKVSNGVGTFLWHDLWNQLGPLLPRFGDRIIYDSAIHRNAHVAEVIGGGRWNWPIVNSADLIAIKNSCGDYPLDDSREDMISWALTSSGVFTITSAWNKIRPRMQVVDWHASVWFPQAIRRHAFIVRLVIHDRLDTQEKLLKWGLINSMSCVFYRANVEDRNHLLFGCHFTAGIWMRVLRLCGNVRMPRNWENEFLWVMGAKGKSFIFITKRIAWGATIYHLWRHRNSRIHENDYSSGETIFHLICNDVRLKVSGLQKVDDNHANRTWCERWSFPLSILGPCRNFSYD